MMTAEDLWDEQCYDALVEEDEYEDEDDEYQRNGFASESDYNRWKYGR